MVRWKWQKKKYYGAKKPIKVWDVDVANISKLTETKNNSKYLIRYLDDIKRPLVLILPNMNEHVKTIKDDNKLLSLHIDDGKLLQRYRTIWTMIGDLNIELNNLPVYDERSIQK